MGELDLTSAEYHADPRMSRSKLKEFADDPQLFYRRHIAKTEPAREPSESMLWGSDVEAFYFNDTLHNVSVVPEELLVERKGKFVVPSNGAKRDEYVGWLDGQRGKRVMKSGEYRTRRDEVYKAVAELRRCRKARALLSGEHHKRLSFTYRDIEWRCELDVVNTNVQLLDDAGLNLPDGCIVDLKTAKANSARAFANSAIDYFYHVQAWMYRLAYEQAFGESLPVVFVVQLNKPSFSVEIYNATEDLMQLGQDDADKAIDHYLACLEEDDWDSPTHNKVIDLMPPKWAAYRSEWESAV